MRRLLLPLVAVALVVSACGSDNNSDSNANAKVTCGGTGTLSGAGSTFVENLARQWVKDFQAACSGTTINYQAVGSGNGISGFINQYGSPSQLDFAASDAVMDPVKEEAKAVAKAGGTPVLHIPWSAGGIAVLYHVTGVNSLKLSADTLAGVFSGAIKKWNDQKIVGDNQGVPLPDEAIETVHRGDPSGTTNAFASYMSVAAPSVWTQPPSKDWPYADQPVAAQKSVGVAGEVANTEGAIGYAEVSFAKSVNMPMAQIKNAAGNFVAPTADAVSAALAEATTPADLKVKVNYAPKAAGAYPISTTTWAIVFAKQPSAAKADLLKAFLTYALGPGQAAGPGLDYAPLPGTLLTQAQNAVKGITS